MHHLNLLHSSSVSDRKKSFDGHVILPLPRRTGDNHLGLMVITGAYCCQCKSKLHITMHYLANDYDCLREGEHIPYGPSWSELEDNAGISALAVPCVNSKASPCKLSKRISKYLQCVSSNWLLAIQGDFFRTHAFTFHACGAAIATTWIIIPYLVNKHGCDCQDAVCI